MFPFKVKCDNQFTKQHLSAAKALVVTQERMDVSHESHWSDDMRMRKLQCFSFKVCLQTV